jgi:uncharacterized membrane protein YgcG
VAVVAATSEEAVRAVAGSRLSKRDRRAIDDAVRDAEAKTGLQFCVYFGPADEDTRAHAESAFVEAGLHARPAVLVLVVPDRRRVEIVTAPDARERLTDDECQAALAEMTPYFARDDFVGGLVVGVNELAERTGPGTTPPGTTDLPNVLG